VRLNELLAAPEQKDWNGDGKVNRQDQWVEVWNTQTRTVDLSGWTLDTGVSKTVGYVLPPKTLLQPRAFLLLFRQQSGLPLDDGGGTLRLLGPTGVLLDSVTYTPLGPDASYSRDTEGVWHSDWPPSPGQPNLPALLRSIPGREKPSER